MRDTRTQIGPQTKTLLLGLCGQGKVQFNTFTLEDHAIENNGEMESWEIKVVNEFGGKPINIYLLEYDGATRLSSYHDCKRINGYCKLNEWVAELPRNFKL